VDVRFRADGQDHFLMLRPREGVAILSGMRTGAWSFADSIPAVVALIREALPDDPAVRAWSGSATAQPQPSADSAAYRSDDIHYHRLPESIRKVPPSYPPVARERGISGVVQVKALVLPQGTIGEVRIADSIPGLDQAAMDAVRAWKFKPARCGDHAIPAWVQIPVRFTLN
jgi:TonB family protein